MGSLTARHPRGHLLGLKLLKKVVEKVERAAEYAARSPYMNLALRVMIARLWRGSGVSARRGRGSPGSPTASRK
jgi:hypothetical protein